MFVDEQCKTCKSFFTPSVVKNDKCKCMVKEDRSWKLQKKNKNGFYFSKLNQEIKDVHREMFIKSLKISVK